MVSRTIDIYGDTWIAVDAAVEATGWSRGTLLARMKSQDPHTKIQSLSRDEVELRGDRWPLSRKATYLLRVADLPPPKARGRGFRGPSTATGLSAVLAGELERLERDARQRESRIHELLGEITSAQSLLDEVQAELATLHAQHVQLVNRLARTTAELRGLMEGGVSAADSLSTARAILTEALVPDHP